MFLRSTSGLAEINGDVIDRAHFTGRVKGQSGGESGEGRGPSSRRGGGGGGGGGSCWETVNFI